MKIHIIYYLTMIHLFKCFLNLGPYALFAAGPRLLTPALSVYWT